MRSHPPRLSRAAPRLGSPGLAGLMTVMFLATPDQTIVSTALPTIVGLEHLSWVVTANLLAVTAVLQARRR